MKRSILSIMFISLLCMLISGCTPSEAKTSDNSNNTDILTIDIEENLATDRNEFVNVPWFSPLSTAIEAFGIERDDIIIVSSDEGMFTFAVPVYLKTFEQEAKMVLRYSLDQQLNDGNGALIELYFDIFSDDEASYQKLLEKFVEIADRPELPYLIEDGTIEQAAENRMPIGTVSTSEGFDEKLSRDYSQNFHVEAGDFVPNEEIARELGNPIAVRVTIWISVY